VSDGFLRSPAPGTLVAAPLAVGGESSEARCIDGYRCRVVVDLARDEVRGLVDALDAGARAHRVAAGQGLLGGRAVISRHTIPSFGDVLIKEYRRGGMLRFVRRRYYFRARITRPERELNSLLAVRAAGLCAPEPVACFSRGTLFYRGWLVTRFIEGRSLVAVAASDPAGLESLIDDLTRQVRLLVQHRVAHVDLHPGNVLVAPDKTVYLLDFDRAAVFDGPVEELRRRYEVRWRRAVGKHGLPAAMAEHFTRGLFRSPAL
jgi:tRNA A-37 threonylcarbamoyl transferase component Bud32